MSFNIIVKKYEHINSSLPNWNTPKGRYISSKKQYDEEMAKGGFIPYDEACKIAEKVQKERDKPHQISKKALEVIQSAKNSSDRKGKVHLSERLIKGYKEVGMNFYNSNIPKHYKPEGGFDNE